MILIIGHEASLTGAPRVLLAFARWLRETKNENIEFILRSGGPLLQEYQAIAPVCIWNREYKNKSLLRSGWDRLMSVDDSRRKRYLRSINRKEINIIFCNTIVNGDILEALSFLNVPVISRIPELEMVIKLYNKTGLADKTFRYSGHFIAVSGSVKENLEKNHGIDSKKISVVHNGLLKNKKSGTVHRTRASLGIPENAFVVGACGTLLWRKGIDLFIKIAFELIKKNEHSDLYFIWIGGDKSGHAFLEYYEEIAKSGMEKNVIITGETPFPEEYYGLLDVFCMTSREEPFGLVMLEAAAHGIPVLCFEQSGYPPEFTTPDVGFVVPFADTEKMAEKIMFIKDHPDLRAGMSDNIRKKSKAFSFEIMAGRIYDIIKEYYNKDK